MLKLFYKIRIYFLAILLPATVLLFYNNEVNKHYHLDSDGNMVLVAHPFGKFCKDPTHPKESNSKNELIKLSNILYSISTGAAHVDIDLKPFYTHYFVFKFYLQNEYFKFEETKNNRSPPFMLS